MFVRDLRETRDEKLGFTEVAVGWLDAAEPFPRGDVSVDFVARLGAWILRHVELYGWRAGGYHHCNLDDCRGPSIGHRVPIHELGSLRLGNTVFWVPDPARADVLFHSPSLIYHYVTKHRYAPPAAFVEAIQVAKLDEDLEKILPWVDPTRGHI